MILDIINNIKNYMFNIKNILNLCSINKYINDNINITNLYNLNKDDLLKIDQNVLEQNKYKKLERLYIYNNRNVYNLNHLKNYLKILNCGIDHDNYDMQIEIDEIRRWINKRPDVNIFLFAKQYDVMKKKMDNLANYFSCGIVQNSISELQLSELHCDGNFNIINIYHLKNTLKILSCCGICGIDQKNVEKLHLEHLKCDNNPKIKNLNHMKESLKVLECRQTIDIPKKYGFMIGDKGISKLKLREIYIGGNTNINDLNHMKDTLKLLDISHVYYSYTQSKISQSGTSNLKLHTAILDRSLDKIDLDNMADSLKILKLIHYTDFINLKSKLSILKVSHLYLQKCSFDSLHDFFGDDTITLDTLTLDQCNYGNGISSIVPKFNLKYLKIIDPGNIIINFDYLKTTLKYVECDDDFFDRHKEKLSGTQITFIKQKKSFDWSGIY